MVYAQGAMRRAQRVQTLAVPTQDRDRYCISDADVITLARQALIIEEHYQRPMDIEWGRDGNTGQIFILQARPETVQSRSGKDIRRYRLTTRSTAIVSGRAIGARIGAGPARLIRSVSEMARVQAGDVLVAEMTDPDWEPIMKRAAAIVTNRGGRTCHAAIIARELGVPAVVGCGTATEKISDGELVTVSCAEGDTGHVYRGRLEYQQDVVRLEVMPPIAVKIMMNVANPDRAFDFAAIPNRGVGLARLEFIINRMIGIHPRALLEFSTLQPSLQATIRAHIGPDADPVEFFVGRLAEGIATIACAFAPEPVIVRLSDFKSNEYGRTSSEARSTSRTRRIRCSDFEAPSRFTDATSLSALF